LRCRERIVVFALNHGGLGAAFAEIMGGVVAIVAGAVRDCLLAFQLRLICNWAEDPRCEQDVPGLE